MGRRIGRLLWAMALSWSAASGAELPAILNVRLGEARLVAKGGLAPVLSTDGTRLLFARKPNSEWHDQWWLASAAGTGARLLFRSAKDPAWSPDGKRIAFNRYLGKVVIYDLAKGREFEVFSRQGGDVNGPWWTADGKALVFREAAMADPEQNVPYLLNLDDLSTREIRTDWRQSEGHPGEVDWPGIFDPGASGGLRFACAAQTEPFSPSVAYSDGSLPALGDHYGGAFPGLWAVSEDGRLAVRLSPKPCLHYSAHPASGHVAFAAPDGIHVAMLAARPAPWNSRFTLLIGTAQGAAVGRHLVVYSKRVNPMNGKVVGFREDDVKGALEIVAVRDGEALAELVEWTGKPLKPDDVAAGEFQRVDNVFASGGRVPDRWAAIGVPLSAAALAGWGGDAGIAVGAKKAGDARRALELAKSGVEHYRTGYADTGLSELREAYQLDSESQFIRTNLGTVLNNVGVERYRAGNRDGGLPFVKEACGLGIEQGCRAAETMGR